MYLNEWLFEWLINSYLDFGETNGYKRWLQIEKNQIILERKLLIVIRDSK